MTAPVPVIETDRLILRAPRLGDLEAMVDFYASDRAHFVGGPCSRFDAWNRLTSSIGHWVVRGYGMWMIEVKATRQPAGRVGILNHDGWPEPELGWHVFNGFEGQGIAHEAALAARKAARELFRLHPVISLIVPENTRSRALAERLGAKVEREGEVLGHACLVYRHPAEEVSA
nr:GNAT family N-acetyltransferase [Paracoccus laeviglucosivorans]